MFQTFTILQQIEVIRELKIHLSSKQIKKYRSTYSRIQNGIYCWYFHHYLSKARIELIEQLDSLINHDYIELDRLKDLGLYETARLNSVPYKISCSTFEIQIRKYYSLKEKVIDNMLFAINLIDYHTNNNTLK